MVKNCNHPTCQGLCRRPKKEKKVYHLKRAPIKAKAYDRTELPVKDNAQDIWYIDRSKEMTGCCKNCSGKTTKGDPKYWKYSICHILGKALFPSIATHPLNFIELCYFDCSCHSNFDNNGYEYTREKMPNAWKIIAQRFRLMYPDIKEKSKIPDCLLQELEPTAVYS